MRREYAVREPHGGAILTVPENGLENALKLVKLIPETKVMTRTVSEYVEWPETPPNDDRGNWAYETCCGKCPGGTCYVDQMTGA